MNKYFIDHVDHAQAKLDRDLARIGDIDAHTRIFKRQERDLLQQRLERLEAREAVETAVRTLTDPAVQGDARPAPASPPSPAAAAVKRQYSAQSLAAWFVLRVHSWPQDAALPSEAEDLVAAKADFDTVPRGEFRTIRRLKTPERWRKPGPRPGR